MESKKSIGNMGEDFAAKKLEEQGNRILCRNFKGAHGEIDIIAENKSYILFVEVKLRKILTEKPANAVDEKKIMHIVDTANEFMREYSDNNYISALTPKFDVFEVYTSKGQIVDFNYIENILQ